MHGEPMPDGLTALNALSSGRDDGPSCVLPNSWYHSGGLSTVALLQPIILTQSLFPKIASASGSDAT